MTKDKKAVMMYEEYKKGFTLSEVGKMFGNTRQSVYTMLKRRDYKLRAKNTLPYLYYKDVKFTLNNMGYYRKTEGDRMLMHRFVYEDFWKKKIPAGHDIHHRDGDKSNNNILNLLCLTKEEHASKYGKKQNQHTKAKLK